MACMMYFAAVDFVDFDYKAYTLQTEPTDPKFLDQWYLDFLEATKAWGYSTGTSKIKVCVVDTGVDISHADISKNILVNETYVKYANIANTGSSMNDENGHGTHAAGIIGAVGNNKLGVTGVNWNVQILPCRFMQKDGSGYLSDAIACFQWCSNQGARIISNSWASNAKSEALKSAMKELYDTKGTIFVAAAGNMGQSNDDGDIPLYPASFNLPSQITVAALQRNGSIAPFSNYGVNTTHIAAPGVDILSTVPGDKYAFKSGTSMAAPQVTGALALMMDASKGKLSAEKLRKILLDSAPTKGYLKSTVANGRVLNLAVAVAAARDAAD